MAETPTKLTGKRLKFALLYLGKCNFNGKQAYIEAGYTARGNVAEVGASKLLRAPQVAKFIQEELDRQCEAMNVGGNELIKMLSVISRVNITQLAEWGNNKVTLKDSKKLSPDEAFIVTEIADTKHGVKIKTTDRLKSIELLMRNRGLLRDNNSETNKPEILEFLKMLHDQDDTYENEE